MCLVNNDVGIGRRLDPNRLNLDQSWTFARAYRIDLAFPSCSDDGPGTARLYT